MARTFAEGLGKGMEALSGPLQRRRLAQNDQLDQATKLAALQEAGYSVNQAPRSFLGSSPMTISRDASATAPKGFVRVGGKLEKDPAFVNPADQALIDYRKSKTFNGDQRPLTTTQINQRDKKRDEIYQTVESNKVNRRMITNAIEGAENIPQGWTGKARLGLAKAMPFTKGITGVNDKMIEDAQEMKMVLTDATLANTAHTKGAISDAEMYLFKEASANDDFNSPGIQPVLRKLKMFLDADENAKFGSFQKNYGEDMRAELGIEENSESKIPEFASEADVPPDFKGRAKVGGQVGMVN